MKALLIIDVQKDFLPAGSLAVPDGDAVIPVINKLQDYFDLAVATQDWHPADHGSFASSHQGKKLFEKTELNGLEQILWPDHCVQGSPGAAFADDLKQEKIAAIFRKGMDAGVDTYSGFYDNGHKKSTGLGAYLKAKNVNEVYVTGLAGDVCVYFTVLDALDQGFKTYLVKDATRAVNMQEGDFARALENMAGKGAVITESSSILSTSG
jgi:nicotinamidase/pyrazinamidase